MWHLELPGNLGRSRAPGPRPLPSGSRAGGLAPGLGALMDQLGRTGAGHGYLAKLETCTAHKVPYPAPCGCAFSLSASRQASLEKENSAILACASQKVQRWKPPPEAASEIRHVCPRPAGGWGLTVPAPECPACWLLASWQKLCGCLPPPGLFHAQGFCTACTKPASPSRRHWPRKFEFPAGAGMTGNEAGLFMQQFG